MGQVSFLGKTYEVDGTGFLTDFRNWDEDFARGLAVETGVKGALTDKHWQVIRFIRNTVSEHRQCPLVYVTCRANGLRLRDLQQLFPTGYLRGACRLAGVTYKEGFLNFWLPEPEKAAAIKIDKIYRVDVRGFLADPADWDDQFAVCKAHELKMTEPLTPMHWQIISYLRGHYLKTGVLPTVYDTCTDNRLELEELERLFPDGYHRGAVKIAGLKAR